MVEEMQRGEVVVVVAVAPLQMDPSMVEPEMVAEEKRDWTKLQLQ